MEYKAGTVAIVAVVMGHGFVYVIGKACVMELTGRCAALCQKRGLN